MRRAIAGMLGCMAASCAPPAVDATTVASRTIHDRIATAEGEVATQVTWFPPQARTHPARRPLVVVEPVLWRRELLLREGELVPWLLARGFPVWLVGSDARSPAGARATSVGIAHAVVAAARAANVDRVDVLALGFNGASTLLALDSLTAPASPVHVGRWRSWGRHSTRRMRGRSSRGWRRCAAAPAMALCALDDGTMCDRLVRDHGALEWLGAIPPADANERAPAAERFPFVGRFVDLPVLFVVGKRDGFAPTEATYPVFLRWGGDARDGSTVPKWLFVAGRENGFVDDQDAYELVNGGSTEGWERLRGFLE